MKQMDWKFVVIWEFHVRPGNEHRFEEIYGSDGEWARLFRSSEGYCGTELNRDFKVSLRYVTLDFWTSRDDYQRFREEHQAEYQVIDQRCEQLTEREIEIGSFERFSSAP